MAKKRKRTKGNPSEEQLTKQLAAAPLVDVLGVLAPSGVGGSCWPGDTRWTLLFSFTSWRIQDGPLQMQKLTVRRKVREREIEEYQELVRANVVTRIRARVVETSVFGKPEALLVKIIGPDASDTELNAEVRRLQQPVRIKDKIFGTFTLDRQVNWFEGRAAWNGRRVRLTLSTQENGDVEQSLRVARTLWRAQKSWQSKVLNYAVQELLPLKNESWLDENERPLNAKQFQTRMKLESISVSPDGSFEFWHDDGELFYGHSILISGSLNEGLYDADIPG